MNRFDFSIKLLPVMNLNLILLILLIQLIQVELIYAEIITVTDYEKPTNASTPIPPSTPSTSSASSISPSSGKESYVTLIAGLVGGGIFGIILIMGFLFVFIKHRSAFKNNDNMDDENIMSIPIREREFSTGKGDMNVGNIMSIPGSIRENEFTTRNIQRQKDVGSDREIFNNKKV